MNIPMNYMKVKDSNGKIKHTLIQRLSDMAFIPNDEMNRDWFNIKNGWLKIKIPCHQNIIILI